MSDQTDEPVSVRREPGATGFGVPTDFVRVHAAASTGFGVGAVIIGPSGAGKTSTVAALSTLGCRIVGDDLIDFFLDGSAVHVVPARLDPILRIGSLGLLKKQIRPLVVSQLVGGEIRCRLPRRAAPEIFAERCRLTVCATVSVGKERERTIAYPISKAEAMAALLGQVSMGELRARGPAKFQQALNILLAAVQSSRCINVILGKDLLRAPRKTMARVLRALGQPSQF